MKFDEILRRWENTENKSADWLDKYPPSGISKESDEKLESPTSMRRAKPQRTIDLHGMNAEDAGRRVDEFVAEAAADGLIKVLVIHGKGNHSTSTRGVLGRVVRERLSAHPLAGATGVADRIQGGSGATWVAIRQRSR